MPDSSKNDPDRHDTVPGHDAAADAPAAVLDAPDGGGANGDGADEAAGVPGARITKEVSAVAVLPPDVDVDDLGGKIDAKLTEVIAKIDGLSAQKSEAEDRLLEIEREFERLSTEKSDVEGTLKQLRGDKKAREDELKNAEEQYFKPLLQQAASHNGEAARLRAELANISGQAQQCQNDMDEARREIERLQKLLDEDLKGMTRNIPPAQFMNMNRLKADWTARGRAAYAAFLQIQSSQESKRSLAAQHEQAAGKFQQDLGAMRKEIDVERIRDDIGEVEGVIQQATKYIQENLAGRERNLTIERTSLHGKPATLQTAIEEEQGRAAFLQDLQNKLRFAVEIVAPSLDGLALKVRLQREDVSTLPADLRKAIHVARASLKQLEDITDLLDGDGGVALLAGQAVSADTVAARNVALVESIYRLVQDSGLIPAFKPEHAAARVKPSVERVELQGVLTAASTALSQVGDRLQTVSSLLQHPFGRAEDLYASVDSVRGGVLDSDIPTRQETASTILPDAQQPLPPAVESVASVAVDTSLPPAAAEIAAAPPASDEAAAAASVEELPADVEVREVDEAGGGVEAEVDVIE